MEEIMNDYITSDPDALIDSDVPTFVRPEIVFPPEFTWVYNLRQRLSENGYRPLDPTSTAE
jgi:hypothetical protein